MQQTTLEDDIFRCNFFRRSGVRSALPAANQLLGKGPTDVDDVSALAR